MTSALSSFRICDFTGQLAGAGATKWLAAFGAEVIRIEDPVRYVFDFVIASDASISHVHLIRETIDGVRGGSARLPPCLAGRSHDSRLGNCVVLTGAT